jgi:parvulin-like peptidyl-prolyl isomerase
MPRRRRRSTVPTIAWERERSAIGRRIAGRSPQFYATAGVVGIVVVAIGIVAFAFLNNYIQDRNRPGSTAIKVEDTNYTVRYFTERMRRYIQQAGGTGSVFGQNPEAALSFVGDELIEEALILRYAADQGQTATDDEIKAEIAKMLTLQGPDDANFDTRLAEELTRTGLSDQQYRDMARAAVLKRKVQEKFTAEIPPAAEAVHYREIILDTTDQTEGDALVQQIEGGTDFAEVAKQRSTDPAAKDNGGDKGWVPRGYLDDRELENTIFALDFGKPVVYATDTNVHVYQVLEKAPDRPVEEAQKPIIAQNKYSFWMEDLRSSAKITNEMVFPEGNLDKIQYAVDRVRQTT